MRSLSRLRGFTLIELLVAITILALIAVFSWRGLDQVVRTRDTLGQSQAVLDTLHRAFNQLARDANAARAIQVSEAGVLSFILPAAAAQGQQAPGVDYVLDADKLVRHDARGSATEVLLDKVDAWVAQVKRADGTWGASVEGAPASSGLRVSLRLKDLGEIQRIFLVHE